MAKGRPHARRTYSVRGPAAAWHELRGPTGETGRRQAVVVLISDNPRVLWRYGESKLKAAILTCRPLLQAWNSGTIVAKGRPGSPLAAPVDIPPPATGYTLIVENFQRSCIVDPTTFSTPAQKKIYDLRFWPGHEVEPPLSSMRWLEAATKRTPPPKERPTGWRELYCRMLAREMEVDPAARTKLSWKTIRNYLPGLGL